MNSDPIMSMERPYLRARRRVRQRVDAGEPRNSYSSIPGFSFRSMSSSGNGGPPVSTTPPISMAPQHHPFLAAAAAARMNGFSSGPPPPGFGHHPMLSPGPFFRPPFHSNGDFPHPGGPQLMHPHPGHFMGMHRAALGHHRPMMFLPPNNHNHFLPHSNVLGNVSSFPPVVNASSSMATSSGSSSTTMANTFHQSVVGDIRAGMAAAACAAAAAVQRAQIFMQQQQAKKSSSLHQSLDVRNGESRGKDGQDSAGAKESAATDGDGGRCASNSPCGSSSSSGKKDLSLAKTRRRSEEEPADDLSESEERDVDVVVTKPASTSSPPVIDVSTDDPPSSLVESSSNDQQQQCAAAADFSSNAPFLKEIIQGKLALAAAAAVASRHHQRNLDSMEQTLAAARDFAARQQHNNNDLKDSKASLADNHQASAFMSHLLKMRQEMALNMSLHQKQQQQQGGSDQEEDDKEEDIMDEEEEELPMDLKASEDDGQSEQSQTSPRSPSSDAGMSTSSGKADKASRLEHIVSSMQRASPSLPKEGSKEGLVITNPLPVNGCKKRKLYQPVQAKATEELLENNSGIPEVKRIRGSEESNDENADPKMSSPSPHPPHHLQQQQQQTGLQSNVVQMHYMEMAKKFLQDQQDRATKEAITKEILADTVGKNNDIADKLVSINPELKGLADLLKSEITASLAIIIDSIVGRFLQATRNNNAISTSRPPLAGVKPCFPGFPGFPDDSLPSTLLPPMPSLKNNNNTPSGRAPQVRDRSAPRTGLAGPVSMYNPLTKINPPTTVSTTTPPAFPLPPTLRPAPGLLQQAPSSLMLNNNKDSEDEHINSSPSPVSRDLSPPEQDEALSLVVTPKKRRHKVTDTRITPRTLSRVLGEQPMADLHKQFPHFAAGLKAHAAAVAAAAANNDNGHSPSRSVPGPHPLFPGMPAPPGLLAGLPTSVAIPNPSLGDFPFPSFYSPPHLPSVSSAGNTPSNAAVRDNGRPKLDTPPMDKHRQRHHSSSDLGRDDATPPSMLRHPSLLSRGSPDFAARLRDDRERDQEDFDRMQSMSFMSGFSMGGEATSSTLTPMHLRKAKLMFFWVRYPSSAILKMYFPDIKFNKNNTAQLVKWFSNFREFFYIQMEKYARQALSEGVKSDSELHVAEESELYRVINVHYNRNNHIEVPEHFLPVVTVALREFFNSIQSGKDAESSWKKQIYKIIQRYDEPIPEYFKTPEFLKQLE